MWSRWVDQNSLELTNLWRDASFFVTRGLSVCVCIHNHKPPATSSQRNWQFSNDLWEKDALNRCDSYNFAKVLLNCRCLEVQTSRLVFSSVENMKFNRSSSIRDRQTDRQTDRHRNLLFLCFAQRVWGNQTTDQTQHWSQHEEPKQVKMESSGGLMLAAGTPSFRSIWGTVHILMPWPACETPGW